MSRAPLLHWIHQVLQSSQVHAKVRLRGNNLHILCESVAELDEHAIALSFKQALATSSLESVLPPDAPQIHRVILYGRQLGQTQPTWTKAISLNSHSTSPQATEARVAVPNQAVESHSLLTQHADDTTCPDSGAEDSTILRLARQGDAEAIARYLSQALSALGVAVRAKLDQGEAESSAKRLLVICESAYTPDSSLLAEPIAQRLRELELEQFRDAIVFGQVQGETRPEWLLRVDLTPPNDILKEWARWGDVQAISRLLNRTLAPHPISLTALLKDSTLHLSCAGVGDAVPDKLTAIATITPVLQTLAPQGIQSVAIYGLSGKNSITTSPDAAPAWVYWLDLAATVEPEHALTTLDLARHGHLQAITFLLTRLLNSDLDTTLATGGIRVQIRQKGDLLHIMTDAPNCPRQDTVAPAIVRFLKPLQIASVSGVRLYGRRSGQKQPLWHYGLDFVSRNRVVPEVTPEFAASDAHVDELLAPAGAIVLWSELPQEGWDASLKRLYARAIEGVQRSLIRTQLVIPMEAATLNSNLALVDAATPAGTRQGLKIALLWSAIGALLVLQTDWLLGYWVRLSDSGQQTLTPAQTSAPAAPVALTPTVQLPNYSLQKTKPHGDRAFDRSAFTQPGKTVLVAPKQGSSGTNDVLAASPLQAKAETILNRGDDFPSFNSRQLDGQIELYRRYLEINGAPDVLIVGSSRALRGVDPAALEAMLAEQGYEDIQVFNLGINGATVQVVDLVVRQMLPQDKLPKLIIFADGARAFNSGRQDITYNGVVASEGYKLLLAGNPPIPSAIAAQTPNAQSQSQDGQPKTTTRSAPVLVANYYQQLNETLNQRLAAISTIYAQRDRLKTKLRDSVVALLPQQLPNSEAMLATSDSLIDSSPSASAATGGAIAPDGQSQVDIDGFLPLSVQFNPTTYYQKYARVSGDYDSDYESFNLKGTQTEAMVALAQYAQSKQIPFVFVNLPLTQEYLDPVRKQHEEAFQKFMLSLAPQTGFIYRDLGSALTTQSNYFSDPSHLNRYGAYEVSRRLAQDVMIPWQLAR
ncbi:MAG: DUF1574 domain-containing protein [Oscillatoriales cyanobacterium C42_A2020_001]|nr:DUF1574 domain-containing protein [Leptolyngbyaceae cyanobacterium C42_A2020_001]